MATLNLGRIKPVFQGAYSNSTAYVVDDIVTFGDETFICIQASTGNATSNASYWTKLAAKGTDGTNVGTTITTQGDILYRDGSGLARLGAGTSGQFLKTLGTGANPVWGDVTTAVLKVETFHNTTRGSYSGSSSYQTIMSGNYTKLSASSKILMISSLNVWGESNGGANHRFEFGSSTVDMGGHYGRSAHQSQITQLGYISNNTQTGSLAWNFRVANWGVSILNPTSSDHSTQPSTSYGSYITIIEYV